ncbi:MAG: hypothetical protein J6A69_05380 [Clostridia bacterium]|nr:hypothetical protein [Clostridia bacterium]
MEKFAVIDIGSNSVRMGIYSDENGFCEHDRKRLNTRLAQGLNSDNLLKDEPIERTVSALKDFRNYIDSHKINTVIAVATESLRRAENASVFTKRVKAEANIDIEIIDGEREAKYGMYAASTSVSIDSYYVLDTGGGSFELSLVENKALKAHTCMPYGAVVLNEAFMPDKNGVEEMLCCLEQRLKETGFITLNSYPVVALGGSVKALASASGIQGDPDGQKISSDQAFTLYDEIFITPVNERSEKFGMEDARKDIIVAGLSPLVTLMSLTDTQEVYFCTRSIRDGVAAEYIKKFNDTCF